MVLALVDDELDQVDEAFVLREQLGLADHAGVQPDVHAVERAGEVLARALDIDEPLQTLRGQRLQAERLVQLATDPLGPPDRWRLAEEAERLVDPPQVAHLVDGDVEDLPGGGEDAHGRAGGTGGRQLRGGVE